MRIIRFYASDEIMSFELITVWTMDKPGRDLRRSKLYLHAILSCLDVCPGPGNFSKTRKQLPTSRSSSVGPEGRFLFFHPKVKVKKTISLTSCFLPTGGWGVG